MNYPVILWLCFITGVTLTLGLEMLIKGDKSKVHKVIFRKRTIKEFAYRVGPFLAEYVPDTKLLELSNKLMYANYPYGFRTETFIGTQFIFALIGLGIGILASTFGIPFFLSIPLILIGFFIPVGILNGKLEKRQAEIRRSIPAMVGLLSTSVKAGVEFAPAFELITNNVPGELGYELRKTQDQINTGTKRVLAFKALSRRVGIDILDRFVDTVNTATERGGMDLSYILEDFIKDVKVMKKLNLEEKAKKLPMKLLLPIMLCMFLPMLVIIMTPVAFTLLKTLN